jgi:hypothetical protein
MILLQRIAFPSFILRCRQVVLPQLPAAVSELISQHNQQVLQLLLQTLKQHMLAAAAAAAAGASSSSSSSDPHNPMAAVQLQQELRLPLSRCCYDKLQPSISHMSAAVYRTAFVGSATAAGPASAPHGASAVLESSTLGKALASTAAPALLASPFMALCGAGDEFGSLSELLLGRRQWLRLHPGGVPMLSLQDRRGGELALNAYALDYFKHRQK